MIKDGRLKLTFSDFKVLENKDIIKFEIPVDIYYEQLNKRYLSRHFTRKLKANHIQLIQDKLKALKNDFEIALSNKGMDW